MTPPPRHRTAAWHRTVARHRTLVLASAAVVLVAAGSLPAALAAQRGSAGPGVAGQNLALSRPVTGSSPCRADEDAAKAVDGTATGLRGKWCSGAATKSLRVDLGSATALSSIVVRHAGSGGERAAYNTRDFEIEVSADGVAFSTAASVRGNTASVTTHSTAATARFVRLTVLRAEQGAGGPARIYELEVYGAPAPQPSTSVSPRPSPPVTPAPSVTPAPPKPSPTVPAPPSSSCFPYPLRDTAQGPNPQIVVNPGVPAVDKKYMDPARTIWVDQWAGAWQRFATPADLRDPDQGIEKMIITTAEHARFGDGTIEIPYKEWVEAVDRSDSGMWMHESAHLLQTGYPHGSMDIPPLYNEGVPDFVRFVSHGEDPAWRLVKLSDVDSDFFTEQRVWDKGYRHGARFLLWLTQHYDKSGAKYQLVHDLNLGASTGNPDWQGLFTKLTGKTYHELFTEYAADRTINPHC